MTSPVRITGATRLYAILGEPIVQVRSPEVYTERFAAIHMNAVLVPALVPTKRFDEVIPALMALGNLDGLLVTVPFKARMLPFASRLGRAVGGMWKSIAWSTISERRMRGKGYRSLAFEEQANPFNPLLKFALVGELRTMRLAAMRAVFFCSPIPVLLRKTWINLDPNKRRTPHSRRTRCGVSGCSL